jgi:5'-methylthioadenosine phosphorylase
MENPPILAVIGGSGLYHMPGLSDVTEHQLDTPFGKPSAPIVVGTLEGQRVAFLARHGLGHTINPTEINYRANIYALKLLGVERLVGVSACGSLREDFAPGDMVIPDQLFDYTKGRAASFFDNGLVAHIGVADPFCGRFSEQVYLAAKASGAMVHRGGVFITIEGPRFSTRAESNVFRSWGMSLIGMTTSPEAFLAREAEMCYAVMAHVTDYDVWHIEERPVSVEVIIATLNQNTQHAQQAVANLARDLQPERGCECGSALKTALITGQEVITPAARQRLDLLVGKYMK